MDTNPNHPPTAVPVRKYRGLGKPAVYFEECDWRDDGAVGIYATRLSKPGNHPEGDMIGILIPTTEGFRVALSEPPSNPDLGGGLIFVWNGDPVSLRFDCVTTSQAQLDLQTPEKVRP